MAKCPTCGREISNNDIRSNQACSVGFCNACRQWRGITNKTGLDEREQQRILMQEERLIAEITSQERQQEAFERAEAHMKSAKGRKSAEEYLKIKKKFENLGDYPGARKKAKECQEEADKIRKTKQRKVRMAVLAAVLIVILAAAVYVVKVFRPSQMYENASRLFEQGDYKSALEQFRKSGDYRDSESQVVLCSALIDLQAGNADSALQSLISLKEADEEELANMLGETLTDAAVNWQENGITPETLLLLLGQQEVFDPEDTIDASALSLDAHLMLAGTDNLLDWFLADENGDGAEELAVLRNDGTVELYQMSETGNEAVTMDRAVLADCLLAFAGRLLETNPEMALSCSLYALEERPDTAARNAGVSAYQQCALYFEEQGDYKNAVEYAKSGFALSPSEETFRFYVQTEQRSCENSKDQETGIALWQDFCETESENLGVYGMEEEARLYTGELCLNYALALASWCDDACLTWFEQAKKEGVEIAGSLPAAIEYFAPGRTRLRLRRMLLEQYETGTDSYEEQQKLLSEELIQLLTDESTAAEDRLVLLLWADDLGIQAEGMDAEAVFRETLAEAAQTDQMAKYQYVDWNQDGWPEMIGLNSEGCLVKTWVTENGLECLSQEESGFGQMEILEEDGIYILTAANDQTAFAVYEVQEGVPVRQFAADSLTWYEKNDNTIAFYEPLEGSIPRNLSYTYTIGTDADQPIFQKIIWTTGNYPLPENPEMAVKQALEALALDLPDEFAEVTSETGDSWYSSERLQVMKKPVFPLELSCDAYWTEETCQLVRAAYQTEEGMAVEYLMLNLGDDGYWRLGGAAQMPMQMEGWTEETYGSYEQLLCLNDKMEGELQEEGESRVYEVILPYAARVTLNWQSGETDGTRTAYEIALYYARQQEEAIASYSLKASPGIQQSQPLFLDAGVYYVNVTAGRDDFGAYTLELTADTGIVIESEPNNTVSQANEMETNTDIHASISQEDDIDLFAFTLEEPAAVSVSVTSEAEQSFTVKLADRTSVSLIRQSEEVQNSRTEMTYLAAGRYLVQIEAGSLWTGAEYCLNIQTDAAGDAEAETNDSQETATPIQLNRETKAESSVEGDVDFYSFVLEEAGLVKLDCEFPSMEAGKETYALTLQSDAGTVLFSQTVTGEEDEHDLGNLLLMPGNYYLKVENLAQVEENYTICISSEKVYAETESNDALSNAVPLECNTSIYGSLLPTMEEQEQDIDNYTFTLDAPGVITVDLAYDQGVSATSVYQITLADENVEVLWSRLADGDVTSFGSGKLWLDAGVYLVQISEGRQKIQTPYQLTIRYSPDEYGEQEPNDTTPTVMEWNQELYASLATDSDVDCFAVTLDQQTTVRLTCRSEEAQEGSLVLKLKQGEEVLWEETYSMADGQTEHLLQIPAGSYVLSVECGEIWSDAVYTLMLERQQL